MAFRGDPVPSTLLACCVALLFAGSVCAAELVRLTDHAWARLPADPRSANGTLFVGNESALIVDPGPTPSLVRRFVADVGEITDRPVRWIVLTQSSADHALGALCLGEPELRVVAHPATRRRLAEGFATMRRELLKAVPSEEERAALDACRPLLPEPVIEGRRILELGDHRIEILHAATGGAVGGLVVGSIDERVWSVGDLLPDAGSSRVEGSVEGRVDIIERLSALGPRHVVPGHGAVGGAGELRDARDDLRAILDGQPSARSPGRSSDRFPEPEQRSAFAILAVLDVGESPRQIAFSQDGRQAFVAAAGADRITRVDVESLRITGVRPVEGRPSGVASLAGGELLVSGVESGKLALFRPGDWPPTRVLDVGRSTSFLVGPIDGRRYLIAIEAESRVRALDAPTFRYRASYETGRRPFPPAVTRDGRKAFVPNHADASVTVIDLWNDRVVETLEVGRRPSAAVALADDTEIAVTLTGEDRIAFLNGASHRPVAELSEGLAREPTAIAASPDDRFLFVGYAEHDEVSAIAVDGRQPIARIPVSDGPTSIAVHPSGRTLWVGGGGSDRLHVIEIPEAAPLGETELESPTEVAVLGTIGSDHRGSAGWGLEQFRETIRRYAPEIVCAEIPPDRWRRIWQDWAEHGVIEDAHILRFPEYTDVLLPLAVELGFRIEPCSAWSTEMAELRQARLRQFDNDAGLAVLRREYERKRAELAARHAAEPLDEDDPHVIHSERFDARARAERSLDDEQLGDWLGPGSWSEIRLAHYRRLERVLQRHAGRRVLILVTAGEKYWFVGRLRNHASIRLIDIEPYLPERDP